MGTASISLTDPMVMWIINLVAGALIYQLHRSRERTERRLDDLERGLPGVVKEATKPLWERFDVVESRQIKPLEATTNDVAKMVATIGADIRVQLSELKAQISAAHPTKADFTAMKADLDRIADRLVPPDMIELKDRHSPIRQRR